MNLDHRRWIIATCLLVVLLLAFVAGPAQARELARPSSGEAAAALAAPDPVARMLLFYSNPCPSCGDVVSSFVPQLKAKYGAKADIMLFDTSEPANLRLLLAMEQAYGIPAEQTAIPELFIGMDVFLGANSIKLDLEKTIDDYLAQGGVELTDLAKNAMAGYQQGVSGTVQGVLFYMPTCSHCAEIIDNYMPTLKQRYGAALQIQLVDVTSDAAYEAFSRLLEAMLKEKKTYGVPTLIIGDTVMIGAVQIPAQAEATIQRYFAEGGVDYVEMAPVLAGFEYQLGFRHDAPAPRTAAPAASLTPASGKTPAAANLPPIHLAYFFQPGCQECDRVQLLLNFMQNRYSQVVITSFDVKAEAALVEWLGERANVPEEKRLVAPAIFVGDDALVDDAIYMDSLEATLKKYLLSGAPKTWEGFDPSQAQGSIIDRFRSLGVLTILLAGLGDGLNPCAFTTLIFFISYLSFSGRKGREILWVGGAFALGVFLTYLAVGLGLSKVLSAFDFLAKIGRWVYGLTAVLCIVLAILSVRDYLKARQGKIQDMALSLPKVLRQRINKVIREGQGAKSYVPIAFVTGAVISIIELACTGQVYLPTIIFVLSVPELRVKAFAYLVLYNLFFILPLIAVFVLAYYGTTTNQLTRFLQTRTATIKLVTAILFVVLAAWLIYALL